MTVRNPSVRQAPPGEWLRHARGVARIAFLAAGVATLVAFAPLAALAAWTPPPGSAPLRISLQTPVPRVFGGIPEEPEGDAWRQWTVKPGDTLARLFDASGLDRRDLARILASRSHAQRLARLRPGETIRYRIDAEGRLRALAIEPEPALRIVFELTGEGLTERSERLPVETRVGFAAGTIERSLFDAGQQAGLSDALILQMAEALGYDIDFALDLRTGDRFALFFEQTYRDGEPVGRAELVAVSFVNRGKRYDALRFQRRDGSVGFYDAEGRPPARALLPAHAGRVHSYQLALQPRSQASDPGEDARASRRGLRRTDWHSGACGRRRP